MGSGCKMRFGTRVTGIESEGGRFTGVRLEGEQLRADRCVVALGSYTPEWLAPLGIRVPVYPVKGYSLTLPLLDEACAPVSTVLDETYKVAVTRFDRRIRVGGMAELWGFDLELRRRRRKTLEHVVRDLFPGGGDVPAAEFWCGLRPMTPDSTPIVGGTGIEGLFLNTGHGTLGWTMAAGSGRLIADLVAKRKPEIDPAGLGIDRYSSSVAAPGVARERFTT